MTASAGELASMRTFLRLKNRQAARLPAPFSDDVRFPEELAATFLRRYTQAGDIVCDPFAGYGTTLAVAEAMGRVAYGVELDPQRCAYIRARVSDPARVFEGDARQLLSFDIPQLDFSFTSPPFVEHGDASDPLTNYATPNRSYQAYLDDLQHIYAQLRQRMRPGARAVLEVANLKGPQGVTTLAWDVARALSAVLRFEGEVVIGWDSYYYGYDHSYCLVFSAPGG
jgi:SAM-dependent methyltransferase